MLSPIEAISTRDDILALLAACDLPVSDIGTSQPPQFFGMRDEARLVALVGLERFGNVALLRSLAVAPSHRGLGLAAQLVAFIEQHARAQGADHLFLLTTSASALFAKLGYLPTARSAAPPAIQATAQFSGLCPASSAFMGKALGGLSHPASGALEVNRQ